jgi:hypothetical protein
MVPPEGDISVSRNAHLAYRFYPSRKTLLQNQLAPHTGTHGSDGVRHGLERHDASHQNAHGRTFLGKDDRGQAKPAEAPKRKGNKYRSRRPRRPDQAFCAFAVCAATASRTRVE